MPTPSCVRNAQPSVRSLLHCRLKPSPSSPLCLLSPYAKGSPSEQFHHRLKHQEPLSPLLVTPLCRPNPRRCRRHNHCLRSSPPLFYMRSETVLHVRESRLSIYALVEPLESNWPNYINALPLKPLGNYNKGYFGPMMIKCPFAR